MPAKQNTESKTTKKTSSKSTGTKKTGTSKSKISNTTVDDKPILDQNLLKDKFIEYCLTKNRRPFSVYQFTKFLEIKEKEFYTFYGSLSKLEKDIWKDFFDQTHKRLEAEAAYQEYGAREKLLAFYFTLIEVLKPHRSYVVFASGPFNTYTVASTHLDEFKDEFNQYSADIVKEGVLNEEVIERPLITGKYHIGLWTQVLFVLNYWISDESVDFAKTDEAIEKAVNLSFELMGRGPIDAIVDFGQFIFKNKVL